MLPAKGQLEEPSPAIIGQLGAGVRWRGKDGEASVGREGIKTFFENLIFYFNFFVH